jgi:hypothetical protein
MCLQEHTSLVRQPQIYASSLKQSAHADTGCPCTPSKPYLCVTLASSATATHAMLHNMNQ